MKNPRLICMYILVNLVVKLFAQEPNNYLNYEVPLDSVKKRAGNGRDQTVSYNYFKVGGVFSEETRVCREVYFGNQLIKRSLFKNGVKHGMERTWYRNGIIESESPYKEGRMYGKFREWNGMDKVILLRSTKW
jgi:antitoxin component YwqK of YwqJK toxin-antitoxin module